MTQIQVKNSVENATDLEAEPPRPLRRTPAPAEPFPVQVLGPVLAGAISGIQEKTQAPLALCAQSVLAMASLAAQGHADILLPIGQRKPISNFFFSIAGSGERKSSVDNEAIAPLLEKEEELAKAYKIELAEWQNKHAVWESARKHILAKEKGSIQERQQKLQELGAEPVQPPSYILTCPEPTFEGLCKLLVNNQPSIGVFSAEGGQFIGGHGMSQDNRIKTAAGLSQFWDGSPIKRVRAGDGIAMLTGKRLSLHLMAQPLVAAKWLSDSQLADQGLFSRLLIVAPESTAGTRFYQETSQESLNSIDRYQQVVKTLLDKSPLLKRDSHNELEPRTIKCDEEAQKAFIAFSDHVEKLSGKHGRMEEIQAFANKLPEHAARLATVVALIDDPDIKLLDLYYMNIGIELAQYYANEALRINGNAMLSPDLLLAERLLEWFYHSWRDDLISLPDIYQLSLNTIGEQAIAKRIAGILEEHGYLIRLPEGGTVKGKRRREVWRIIRGKYVVSEI